MAAFLHFHESDFTRETRAAHIGQKGFTVWFTGVSGSGKSTIAVALEKELITRRKLNTYRLDGDNIRSGLNKGLGFTEADRTENIRRIGEVAKLFSDSGMVTLTSFISPFAVDRAAARKLHDLSDAEKERGETPLPFIEVYVYVPPHLVHGRDKKGLAVLASKGLQTGVTGVGKTGSARYEEPETPEIRIENDENMTIDRAVKQVIDYLEEKGLLSSPPDIETAEAESAKRVKEGQDIKEKRLLRELDERDAALKAAKASGDDKEIVDAYDRATKAAGALKAFYTTKHRLTMEATEAGKLAGDMQSEIAKLAEQVATYTAGTETRAVAGKNYKDWATAKSEAAAAAGAKADAEARAKAAATEAEDLAKEAAAKAEALAKAEAAMAEGGSTVAN
ncbi:adenylyl-sulfate kinase [Trichophyton mentagrophytes]|nr:adenylyl-sulfate kinase [Trichophyton mentagrophytes]